MLESIIHFIKGLPELDEVYMKEAMEYEMFPEVEEEVYGEGYK
ncbi:hypothetical protein NYQ66_05825 [Aquibacillus koreensis]|nr:hypothetical protein [Aquibacillus koreensis]MCT2535283.1 hypothetical protein [Aquibacillus koreensis]